MIHSSTGGINHDTEIGHIILQIIKQINKHKKAMWYFLPVSQSVRRTSSFHCLNSMQQYSLIYISPGMLRVKLPPYDPRKS